MKKRVLLMLMAVLLCLPFAVANAATKTSADFADLKDLDAATKAKFDALISAGVFDGVSEGNFGLKDEMNRAQFAKVAALIFNLQVDTALKTSSFKDVKADDPANGYALPYIEAIKAAGITEGYGQGKFNPAGTVTKEQLATFLVRGLGKNEDAKTTPGVNDATVSDWAKGYVALALEIKLMSNGADGKFGGTTNATRDLLVTGAYEAKEQYVAQVEQKKKEEEQKKEEERKKKEEEEKKKKEDEDKKQEESTPPPSSSTPPSETVTVSKPTASPAGGTVAAGTQVTLSSFTFGAEIRYTLNGETPTASSTIYNGPITITENVTIKAIAIKSGATNSPIMSESYTVSPATLGSPGSKSVRVDVTPSVTGSVYSVVTAVTAPPPSTEMIIAGYAEHALDAQVFSASAGIPTYLYVNGLPQDDTNYTLYLLVTDGSVTSGPYPITIKTPPAAAVTGLRYEADSVHPFLGNMIVTFNGPIDAFSAMIATNYRFSRISGGNTVDTTPPEFVTQLSPTEYQLNVGDWFYEEVEAGDQVRLDITSVLDLSGNVIQTPHNTKTITK